MKVCAKCRQNLALSAFCKSRATVDGLRYWCRQCCAAYKKIWNARNPERIKSHKLRDSFGITIEQYNEKLQTQNFCCAICKIPQVKCKKKFAVDHDHNTGQLRDLLCETCNRGLGLLKDNSKILRQAAAYLERHKEAGCDKNFFVA